MLDLYLIRHGETDYNRLRIVQGGGVDSDLNETGIQQGVKFYQHYQHIQFDAIYASGLKRTHQTLAPFIQAGYSLKILPELNEMGWGELEGQPFDEIRHQAFLEMNEVWEQGNLDIAFPGGESPKGVWARASEGLNIIKNSHPSGKVLICTHGRTLRIVLSMLTGKGLNRMNDFPHDNTGLNIITVTEQGYSVQKINSLDHLN